MIYRTVMSKNAFVSCLCFSMDRPLQLDGYLRSVRECLRPAVSMTVLYRASNDRFEAGYTQLVREHPDVVFIKENDFGQQVRAWVEEGNAPYRLFGCDDVVFYRPADLEKAVAAFSHKPLLGFSLRLGRNIRFTHKQKEEVSQPAFEESDGRLFWKWLPSTWDWCWAFEANGTLYRREVLRALLGVMENLREQRPEADWRHPNKLEMVGNQVIRILQGVPEWMACFPESCLVVPTVNQVQTLGQNPLLGELKTPAELEEMRRAGQRLDVAAYRAVPFNRIHVGDFFLAPNA